MLKNLLPIVLLFAFALELAAATRWHGEIPKNAKNPDSWRKLLSVLEQEQMYYSAMSTANRMLLFFNDLKVKEDAYRAIVKVSGQGYPFPTRHMYLTSDLEPKTGYYFVNSFNLYKGIVNREKGLEKWAEHYFKKIDRDHFPKYLFYTALTAYEKKDLEKAANIINKLLKMDHGPSRLAFVKKISRTLARIYFEMEHFDKSLDIYLSFLLKTNPVKSTDWLEAAWSFYHLGRFEEALGILYNLESETFSEVIHLEKFILRALIYRAVCETEYMEGLSNSFNRKFGKIVHGVKTGKSMNEFEELNLLSSHQHRKFFQYHFVRKKLREESKRAVSIPADLRVLYDYMLETEDELLVKNARLFQEESRHKSVRYLIMLSENLKFLKFDVELEKHNPDVVFEEPTKAGEKADREENPFSYLWPQTGDFWADERNHYRGKLENKCRK